MTREFGPRCVVFCQSVLSPKLRGYLVHYDPEAYDGRGAVRLSDDRRDALVFDTAFDVMQMRNAVPKCHPIRKSDGKPNRPLSAYHVEILRYDDPRPPLMPAPKDAA